MTKRQCGALVALVLLVAGCAASDSVAADGAVTWKAPSVGTDKANIAWRSPSKSEKGAMPIGNGTIVANVWAETNGPLMLSLAQLNKDGKALKLGLVRVRVAPNPFKASLPFRQTLVFSNGAVDVTAGPNDSSVKCSVWVDANRPMVHVQIRAKKDVKVQAVLVPPGNKAAVLPAKKDRVAWWCGSTGAAIVGQEMATKPGNSKALTAQKAGKSFDIRVVVPNAKAESAKDWGAAAKGEIDTAVKFNTGGAVKPHLDVWAAFLRRGAISVAGPKNAGKIGRSLLLMRWMNAIAGRGTDLLKSAAKPKTEPKPEKPEWTVKKAGTAFNSLFGYVLSNRAISRSRFPIFWGTGFDKLPADGAAEKLIAKVRAMLVLPAAKKMWLFPAWPRNVSVAFSLPADDKTTVEAVYHKGVVSSIRVEPMMKTGDFIGTGPYRKTVRIAKAGPARLDQMIVFVGTIGADDKMTMEECDAIYKKIADAGLTGIGAGPEHLDLAQKHGLKVRFGMDMNKLFNEGAAKYKNHPAIACVFLSDRRKRGSFPVFRLWADHLRKVGFNKGYDYITRAIWGDIEHFINTVRPNMLDFYHYHWMRGRRGGWFVMYLNYYNAMANAAGGIPLMRCTDFNPQPIIKLRQTMYVSLACGVKAFHFWTPWNIHLGRNKEGKMIATLMDQTKEVAAVSRDMKKFSPILIHSKCTQIVEANDPNKPVPDKLWVQLRGRNLVMGIHEDDDLNKFVFVANKDIGAKQAAVLIVPDDATAVEKVSKKTGKWVAMPMEKDGEKKVVKFTLAPADGELMRVVRPKK